MLDQFEAEGVLLQNLLFAPTVRTIKFGNQRLRFIDTDLIDPVLIAVERKDAAVTDETLTFDGVHDVVGGKSLKRMVAFGHCAIPVIRHCVLQR